VETFANASYTGGKAIADALPKRSTGDTRKGADLVPGLAGLLLRKLSWASVGRYRAVRLWDVCDITALGAASSRIAGSAVLDPATWACGTSQWSYRCAAGSAFLGSEENPLFFHRVSIAAGCLAAQHQGPVLLFTV
jgi:hypothetical protein